MDAKKVKAVIKAWHLLESATPSHVPDRGIKIEPSLLKDGKDRPEVESACIEGHQWQGVQLSDESTYSAQSHYYMNCFRQSELTRFLRLHFKSSEESINEDSSLLFGFNFSVDSNGRYIQDSLFVPFVMYLINKLKAEEAVEYSSLADEYASHLEPFKQQAEQELEKGINEQSLQKSKQAFSKFFGELEPTADFYIKTDIQEIDGLHNKTNYNSPYLEDLQLILDQGENDTIRQYIEGADAKTNIDENREYIEHALQPKFLPAGRWFSPVEHRLSLMQQVVVNQILNNGQLIDSVNGPPGTGKTTLLKEIFANVVVQRALKMATFEHPAQAFTVEHELDLAGNSSPFPVFLLDEALTGFSMVVASSKQAAVENIAKEVPQKTEAIRPPEDRTQNSHAQYEEIYAKTAARLAHFPDIAERLLDTEEEAWGLFSCALGESEQIDKFANVLKGTDNDSGGLTEQLEQLAAGSDGKDWQQLVQEFQGMHAEIEEKKAKLQLIAEGYSGFEADRAQLAKLKQQHEHKPHKETERAIKQLEQQQLVFSEQLKQYEQQGLVLPTEEYWQSGVETYRERQQKTIWLTDELNFERGLLFLKAMELHKLFLAFNHEAIAAALNLLATREKLDIDDERHVRCLRNMWNVIHLITPVIGTTFASMASMYRGVGMDFIQYLFIDEGGQASPQQAAGALWRSRKAIVVGDPVQIEPEVTIDETIMADIRKHFQLDDIFMGPGASIQLLADRANPNGTWKKDGGWIGTPLWVHRRCPDPLFSISNEIGYDGKMVLAKTGSGKVGWHDCKGTATNRHYIEEQGELVAGLIADKWSAENGEPDVFVITPFTAVREGLKTIVRSKLESLSIEPEKIDEWIGQSIGTVHSFQGQEAETVYFVVGTDADSDSAAEWSCAKPNLLNVAVTRAKKEFYIVADRKRFSEKNYYQTIATHAQQDEEQAEKSPNG